MVDLGHVRVCSQSVAQRVVAVGLKDGTVGRVDGQAAGLRVQGGIEFEPRHRGIQCRVEEERDGDAVCADLRRDDPVQGGFQVTVSGELEHLADVDDEGAGDGWRVDPLPAVFDLQAALVGFDEEQGEYTAVAVGANALFCYVR